MKTSALRAGALGCALLTSTALTAPAFAQSAPPPRFQHVDANGVDLISGRFVFSLLEGSIGSGDGAVTLERSQRNDYGRTDQWSGVLYQRTSGGTSLIYVQFGGQSDTFTISGSTFASTKANGATLVAGGSGYIYTAPDGTTANFGVTGPDMAYPWKGPGCTLGDPGTCAIPMSVTRPNGTGFTLNWDVVERCHQYDEELNCLNPAAYFRFDGVTSSTGYNFSFTYASDNPGLPAQGAPPPNWYQRTGATFTNTVTTPPTLPTVTYAVVSGADEITDTGGGTWRITSSSGNITGIRRPGSSSDDITVSYGTGGVVASVTRDGVTTNYSRSISGGIATTTISDALSQQTVVVADLSKERITSITDALSRTSSFQYDTSSRLTQTTQPEGNYVQYTYDGRGNVTETRWVAKSGTGVPDIVRSASYPSSCISPACNRPDSTTDEYGNTANYTYDSTHGGVLSVTAPALASGERPQVRYTYQLTNGEYRVTEISACSAALASNPASCVGTNTEARSIIGYDSQGRVTSVTRRNGDNTVTSTGTLSYDSYGNLLTVDGPLSGTGDLTRIRYNSARQVVGVAGPDPDATGSLHHRALRVTYRSDGLPTKVERGTVNSQSDSDWSGFASLEEMQIDYDSNDRPSVQRVISGGTTFAVRQMSYDTLGRTHCAARRMNPSIFSSLPSSACNLGAIGSYGEDRITRSAYDAVGRISELQTAYGVSGQVASEVATTYTNNGRVATLTDAEGNRTTYEYDGQDRLFRTWFPSPTTDGVSSTSDYEQLTYETHGNGTRTSGLVDHRRLRDGNEVYFTYDSLARLTVINRPGSDPDTTLAYDLFGRLASATAGGRTQSLQYDALGRVTNQTGPVGNNYQILASTYDTAGRRTRLNYGGGLEIGYTYFDSGEMKQVIENPSTTNATLATYSYDDLGRRTSITRANNATTSYSYDSVSRLSQLTQDLGSTSYDVTLSLTYNPADQIASVQRSNDNYAWTNHYAVNRNYTSNGLNQYTAAGSVAPTYDSRGNLTSAGPTTYTHDSDNHLVSAGSISLAYDPYGRLLSITSGGLTTQFGYDGLRLVAEYDPATSIPGSGGIAPALRRFVFGAGVDEPLVWYEGSGLSDRRWFHADERGSISAITNNSGTLTNINAYDEYGIPQSSNAGRFQYTGQAWLPELGMYYFRARIFSPTLGRFLQADPIGVAGGTNLYAYVSNDPINRSDPTGLRWVTVCVQMDPPAPPSCGWRWIEDNLDLFPPLVPPGPGRDPNDDRPPFDPINCAHGECIPPPPTDEERCAAARNQVADATKIRLGTGFNRETAKVLDSLVFGGPSSLTITSHGMEILGSLINRNPGGLSDGTPVGGGITSHSFNFATGYSNVPFGSGGYGTYGQSTTAIGSLLGQATVYMDGNDLVGVFDVFDYEGEYASPEIQFGVDWANNLLRANCPDMQDGVTITGGSVPG